MTADAPMMGAHLLGASAQGPTLQIPDGTPTDVGVTMMPLSCSFDGAWLHDALQVSVLKHAFLVLEVSFAIQTTTRR